jgi:hypothetical protein
MTPGGQISSATFPNYRLNNKENENVRITTSDRGVFRIASCGGRPPQHLAHPQTAGTSNVHTESAYSRRLRTSQLERALYHLLQVMHRNHFLQGSGYWENFHAFNSKDFIFKYRLVKSSNTFSSCLVFRVFSWPSVSNLSYSTGLGGASTSVSNETFAWI